MTWDPPCVIALTDVIVVVSLCSPFCLLSQAVVVLCRSPIYNQLLTIYHDITLVIYHVRKPTVHVRCNRYKYVDVRNVTSE